FLWRCGQDLLRISTNLGSWTANGSRSSFQLGKQSDLTDGSDAWVHVFGDLAVCHQVGVTQGLLWCSEGFGANVGVAHPLAEPVVCRSLPHALDDHIPQLFTGLRR